MLASYPGNPHRICTCTVITKQIERLPSYWWNLTLLLRKMEAVLNIDRLLYSCLACPVLKYSRQILVITQKVELTELGKAEVATWIFKPSLWRINTPSITWLRLDGKLWCGLFVFTHVIGIDIEKYYSRENDWPRASYNIQPHSEARIQSSPSRLLLDDEATLPIT